MQTKQVREAAQIIGRNVVRNVEARIRDQKYPINFISLNNLSGQFTINP